MFKLMCSYLILVASPLFASGGGHYSWLSNFTHGHEELNSVVASLMVLTVLFVIGIIVQFNKSAILEAKLPSGKFNLFTILEIITEMIMAMIENIIPKHAEKYFPLVGTIAVYIFVSNISALIPGFVSPSTSISNNLAIGLCSFIFYNYQGIKEHGGHYINQFIGPVIWLAPFMMFLELISHVIRPFSLSLRLFGNMNGDHSVLLIFSELIPLGIPIIFLGLGLVVSAIQTYIFSVLSLVYISMAVSHDH